MPKQFSIFTLLVLWLLVSTTAVAQTPIGWRTDGTGTYPDASPPTKWSKTKNVVWSARMPARSNAQPIIVGDRLFVCAEPFELICMRVSDGKQLWSRRNSYRDVTDANLWAKVERESQAAQPLRRRLKDVQLRITVLEDKLEQSEDTQALEQEVTSLRKQVQAIEDQLRKFPLAAKYKLPITQREYNGYTTATPTSDGRFVWAVFGNRVVACYNTDGQLQWADVLPDAPQSMWGHSSSPLIVGDKLIVSIDRIVCYDAHSGRQIWVTKYGQSWGSPTRAKIGGEAIILMSNGRILRASDGKVLKRVPGLPNASPFVRDKIAYYADFRSEAYRLPDTIRQPFTLEPLWTAELKGRDFFASAVVHDGLLYAVSTRHVLNVVDGSTGETVYVKRLSLGNGPVWASLCVAGNYLYVSSRDGTTLVLKTGRQYKEVAKNRLEYFISTPVFHKGRMYVRTSEHLYCIGESS